MFLKRQKFITIFLCALQGSLVVKLLSDKRKAQGSIPGGNSSYLLAIQILAVDWILRKTVDSFRLMALMLARY